MELYLNAILGAYMTTILMLLALAIMVTLIAPKNPQEVARSVMMRVTIPVAMVVGIGAGGFIVATGGDLIVVSVSTTTASAVVCSILRRLG